MEAILTNKLKIDKTDWTLVKFGDVVAEGRETVRDFAAEDIRHVVGLEHIDSENIHLTRSENIEASTTFTKKFKKGDVLFGRRRAYLKKAAQAPFDGICSGDITVLRARKGLLPELLPFLVCNDKFFDYAIKHSAGGLSPRVKFKDLANYEFLLPPKDQQAKLAELLWAMDEVVEKERKLWNTAKTQFEVSKDELILKGISNNIEYSKLLNNNIAKDWKVTTVGGLLKRGFIISVQDGNHGEIHPKSSEYVEDGIPFIMANTIENGKLNFEKSKKLPQAITNKLRIGFSLPGDVLLSHKGTVGQAAIVPEYIEWPYLMLTPQVTYYRTNPDYLSKKFLYYTFTSSYFQKQLKSVSSQSTRAYVGITSQRALKIVIPNSLPDQEKIAYILTELEENLRLIESKIAASKSLQKSLINQIF